MNHPAWFLLHPRVVPETLGLIPGFLDEDDPRPAREQFNERYAQGGGWQPFVGFSLDPRDHTLSYADDPVLHPLAVCLLHERERIVFYDHAWVLILQPDGSYEIARID
jgi:hypothetical protein